MLKEEVVQYRLKVVADSQKALLLCLWRRILVLVQEAKTLLIRPILWPEPSVGSHTAARIPN